MAELEARVEENRRLMPFANELQRHGKALRRRVTAKTNPRSFVGRKISEILAKKKAGTKTKRSAAVAGTCTCRKSRLKAKYQRAVPINAKEHAENKKNPRIRNSRRFSSIADYVAAKYHHEDWTAAVIPRFIIRQRHSVYRKNRRSRRFVRRDDERPTI